MTAPRRALERLVAAVRAGDGEGVAALVRDSPALLSSPDPASFGATPLIHAVVTNDRAIVDLLLDAGAEIDARSDWWAGGFGVLDHSSDEMSTYLLERGATLTPHAAARLGLVRELESMLADDPDCVHARGGDGQYPLHFARTSEIADLLLRHGAEIDARDVDHESTAGQWQATRSPAVASHLLDRGCERDPFLAAAAGRVDVLEDLAAVGPDVLRRRVSREWFSTRGERAAEHIYFYTIGEGMSLLHAAALTDQKAVIRWLVEAGADVDAPGGYDDQTPLHTAAWHDALDAAAALLESGANLEARSGKIHRNQPVGWAIVSGGPEMVRLLRERGARIHPQHLEAAEAGARGDFRQYNRTRSIEEWVEVRDLLREG